jgi:hypothetical protein
MLETPRFGGGFHYAPVTMVFVHRSVVSRVEQFRYPTADSSSFERGQFERVNSLWGTGDVDGLFKGGPQTTTPWPRAPRDKKRKPYDEALVKEALNSPAELEDFDPRNLHSTQPGLTRQGVDYYMNNDYARTGETFADKGNAGNRYPVVYSREDGVNMLLSGHHRGSAALLQGKQFPVRRVEGPWGT